MNHHILSGVTAVLLLSGCNAQPGEEAAPAPENSTAASNEAAEVPKGDVDKLGIYPGAATGDAPDRFVTGDSIERVVEWYNDPARREEMMFISTERQDDGYLVVGTADMKPFALTLASRPDGGTEGRLLPYDPKVGLKQ